METIHLSQLAYGILLVFLNIALVLVLKLDLAKTILVATVRSTLQLFLLGLLLNWVFLQNSPLVIIFTAIFMIAVASHTAIGRTQYRFKGIYPCTILAITFSLLFTTGFGILVILRPDPWYNPMVTVPILGLVIGNSLSGISLSLDNLIQSCVTHKIAIETKLALGATKWEAVHEAIKASIQKGLIPIINSMMVVGLVTLPGMMSGQLLAGANPGVAVQYQLLVLILILTCSVLATITTVLLTFRRLFNEAHQIQSHLIKRIGG